MKQNLSDSMALTNSARAHTHKSDFQRAGTPIEPGLLAVFRTGIGIQMVFGLFPLIATFLGPEGPEPRWSTGFNVVWLVLLSGYLLWPRLRVRLGWVYLPLAITAVTVFTLLEYSLWLPIFVSERGMAELDLFLNSSGWLLLLRLLLPLVLTAWQYNFPAVAGFILGATLLDLALTGGVKQPLMTSLIGLAMARALIYALVGIIVTRIMAGQRTQRQTLAEANRLLVDHAATLEQLTISRERNRLAHELHDTLAHTLSAVAVQLEAVDSTWEANPAKAHELLHKSLAQTRSGLTETRRALQALRASPLEDLGLALAVRALAESTAQRGPIALEFTADAPLENLSPNQEQQIYRIAQEALTNVLKHAGARTLRVQLGSVDGQTRLTVTDDGQGIDRNANGADGHYGLQGMRERAALIGAILAIESSPGQGTTVRLTF